MKNENKIIAEFMGVDIIPLEQFVVGVQSTIARIKIGRKDYICPMIEGYLLEHLQYHTSWNWLMPVVEKIENFGFEIIIAESRCKIKHNTDHSIEELLNVDIIGTKRESTYQAVVEFIKQH